MDLIAENTEDYEVWTSTLGKIIQRSLSVLEYMHQGAWFIDCQPERNWDRKYFLSPDNKHICFMTDDNTAANVVLDLSTVMFIRCGQDTSVFRQAHNVAQFEGLSFSLVYGADFETLNLIANKAQDYDLWMTGLEWLVSGSVNSQLILQKGISICKIHKSGKVTRNTLYLSKDKKMLMYSNQRGKQKMVVLSSIKEVRLGMKTDTFAACASSAIDSKLCFSVIYGDSYKTLDLCVPDARDFLDARVALEDLLYDAQEQPRAIQVPGKAQLHAMFGSCARRHGKNKSHLQLKHVCNMLFTHQVTLANKVNVQRIYEFFQAHGTRGTITETQFVRLYDQLSIRPEIAKIMQSYGYMTSSDELRMSAFHLQHFLINEQREPASRVTLDYCKALIAQHEPPPEARGRELGRRKSLFLFEEKEPEPTSFSLLGFASFLMSIEGDLFNPNHDQIYQDMTQPLQHYFIATSHNTFLTADQFKGPSSVEAYIRVLQRGCRSVEVDCWDGPAGEPVVYHGHTLTSKIAFRDVILCLDEYAFKDSPYPLIISIENHCCLSQQRFMARFMKEVFGNKLVEAPVNMDFSCLPSPDALKHKILIKCHKPMGLSHPKIILALDDDGSEDSGMDNPHKPCIHQDIPMTSAPSLEGLDTLQPGASLLWDLEDDAGDGAAMEPDARTLTMTTLAQFQTLPLSLPRNGRKQNQPVIRLHSEFAKLVVYTGSAPRFQHFGHALQNYQCWQMVSFGETRSFALVADPLQSLAFLDYGKRHNSRCFPNSTRVDSSNYNPQPLWNVGMQMVALNYQTDGTAMQINQGKFRQNGRCGYLLKPVFLRDVGVDYKQPSDPFTGCATISPKTLFVSVISAQCLPRAKVVSPFVTIEVVGAQHDNAYQRTGTKFNDGLAPNWQELFCFPVGTPELSLLRFVVRDYRGKILAPGFLGEATLPLVSVRQGYRHVRLNAANGEPLSATLFVKVWMEDGEHSQEWWNKCVRPPIFRDKREPSSRLYSSGFAELDFLQKEFQSLYKKTLAARERTLQLLDKTIHPGDRHPTISWNPAHSMLAMLRPESAPPLDTEKNSATVHAQAQALADSEPAYSVGTLRKVMSFRSGSTKAAGSLRAGSLANYVLQLEESLQNIQQRYAQCWEDPVVRAFVEGAVPVNGNTERCRNALNYNKRRVDEVAHLLGKLKRWCVQLATLQERRQPPAVVNAVGQLRRRLSNLLAGKPN